MASDEGEWRRRSGEQRAQMRTTKCGVCRVATSPPTHNHLLPCALAPACAPLVHAGLAVAIATASPPARSVGGGGGGSDDAAGSNRSSSGAGVASAAASRYLHPLRDILAGTIGGIGGKLIEYP